MQVVPVEYKSTNLTILVSKNIFMILFMKMSLPLLETSLSGVIYSNLAFLMDEKILTSDDRCEVTAIEYANLRIPGFGPLLHRLFLSLQDTNKKEEFKAYHQVMALIQDLETNQKDGFYWVIFADSNKKLREENKNILTEVLTHVFILEKQGEKMSLVHTYVNIGNRRIIGIPLFCQDRAEIVKRMTGISRLLSFSETVATWNSEKWYTWLKHLELPPVHLPPYLKIHYPRCMWGFVEVSNKGSLHEITNLAPSVNLSSQDHLTRKNNILPLYLRILKVRYEEQYVSRLI
ncbi:Hypothetical protein BQ3484_502 [Cedratvirus A11]|uniref:Uncharacterized protein n=1 Tax=Cedratvirus A11 TaxID=1903266 RepID=A0A1M7XVG7_9VIRU|nr:Hypothetical protein BQ3484_502 [Cedratvirus A11]SHO33570.1 Hypothetical protein BQ3484_502 [Cedratvirus A11]